MNPPRIARALLRHAVADDDSGQSVIGDFDDEFRSRCAQDGRARARFWYWRQAAAMWCWSAARHPAVSHHYPRGGVVFDCVADVRHAWRVATAAPGQSALIVATLALAIGTTTIGFAFADTVFLRGLPIANPNDTVIIYGIDAREPERRTGVFFDDYLAFRERARTVETLSTWTQTRVTLLRRDMDAERITVSRVTGDLFAVWELQTQFGRGLRSSDSEPGAARVAVLSDRFWADRYSRSPRAVGESVLIDGAAHEIVGVLGPDIEFGTFANIAMWVSHPPESYAADSVRDVRPTMLTGRLADGVSVSQAAAEFRTLASQLEQDHPDTNRGRQALVLPANRAMGGPNLWLVMTLLVGTAALVTIIASVNVAGVLLSRAVSRQREFAMRVALGARRLRVFRQLAIEGLLLASLGAAGGLVVAESGLRVIHSVDAEPIFQQIVIDWHEVLFIVVVASVTPFVFSLAPALAALRVNLVSTLNAGTIRMTGSGRRFRDALVVTQLALAVGLAVVGGLVGRTARAQMTAPNGFDVANLMIFNLAFSESIDAHERRAVIRAMHERLRIRGVTSAGTLDVLPAAMIESSIAIAPNDLAPAAGGIDAGAHRIAVDAQALEALKVAVIAGRGIAADDIDRDASVALISQETARRHFANADDAVGRRLTVKNGNNFRSYRIVGVTADVRDTDPERGMPPRVWVPMTDPRSVYFAVRSSADAATAAVMIRAAARELLPGVPLEGLERYDRAIARMHGGDRVAMGMLLSFASVAILFAGIGLYGTVALTANVRQPEFATRVALGAQRSSVVRLVLGQAMKLLAWGLLPGMALGLFAAMGMRRLLFGVTPLDPLNVAGVMVFLVVVTLLASAGPALRAARMDIVDTLRRG